MLVPTLPLHHRLITSGSILLRLPVPLPSRLHRHRVLIQLGQEQGRGQLVVGRGFVPIARLLMSMEGAIARFVDCHLTVKN